MSKQAPTRKSSSKRAYRRKGSTLRYGSFHLLLWGETELNPIYAEYERPTLQELWTGEPPTGEPTIPILKLVA